MISVGLVGGLVAILAIQIISNKYTNDKLDNDFSDNDMKDYHSSNYILILGIIIGVIAITSELFK